MYVELYIIMHVTFEISKLFFKSYSLNKFYLILANKIVINERKYKVDIKEWNSFQC